MCGRVGVRSTALCSWEGRWAGGQGEGEGGGGGAGVGWGGGGGWLLTTGRKEALNSIERYGFNNQKKACEIRPQRSAEVPRENLYKISINLNSNFQYTSVFIDPSRAYLCHVKRCEFGAQSKVLEVFHVS